MEFKYYIITDLNLILECYIGEFKYKDIFESKMIEMSDPEWKNNYNVLADIRDSKFLISESEIKDLHKHYDLSVKRKSALLTNFPSHVVFGTFLKNYNIKESLILPEVFSTVEAALFWLDINLEENERVKEILNELSGNINI